MSAGILATAWMCLVLSQSPNDVFYTNQRNHRIPVKLQEARRDEIRELMLFVSTDQGRTWSQGAASVAPEKDASFALYTKGDGLHWLRVVTVSRQGKQDPDDKSLMSDPPSMKIMVDTVKPIIKVIRAQRQGEDVYVDWDIQEENPDRDGIRLEYQVKDSPGGAWTVVPVPFGLYGQARFRSSSNQPLVVRLTVRDLASNQSFGLAEVAGTTSAVSFHAGNSKPSAAPVDTARGNLPSLPKSIAVPRPPVEPPPSIVPKPGPLPPPPEQQNPPVKPEVMQVLDLQGQKPLVAPPSLTPPPSVLENRVPAEKPIADSREQQKKEPVHPPLPAPGSVGDPPSSPLQPKPKPNAAPPRKPLPTVIYVNSHQVTLEYHLTRITPSGVGGVELWLTRDDGATWEQYAEDEDAQGSTVNGKQKRTFDFRDNRTEVPFADGVYGLTLVVKSRAGRGRKPCAGDVPDIRIEIDTEKPLAQLFKPIPDPQRPDHVLLKWNARDRNLIAKPICLEYAEKRDGPWQPIQLDLENKGRSTQKDGVTGESIVSGDYSWKLPEKFPVQVYLRLRVRDKAGNESIATTSEPQYVDLTEPEGVLTGAAAVTKQPLEK